jgi:hypothetical protein
MKSAFDKIAAGLKDAIAHAQGDEKRGRVHAPQSPTPGKKEEPVSGRCSGS